MSDNTKKIPYTGILIALALIVYACIRMYGYYVPEKNVTVYFKKDWCDINETVGEPKNDECYLKGDLRIDLTGDDYFLKVKNGQEIYFSKDVLRGIKFEPHEKE